MRITVVVLLACTLCPALAAQDLEKLPRNLQGLLDRALASNPELLVAQARLAEAEAELRRLQLQVTQEVVSLNTARRNQAETIDASAQQYDYAKKLHEKGLTTETEVVTARSVLVHARGKLADVESQLRYTCGLGLEGQSAVPAVTRGAVKRPRVVRPSRPDALAQKLRMPVEISFTDVGLDQIAHGLAASVDGFSILIGEEIRNIYGEEMYSLVLDGPVPLESALTALHDKFEHCVFVLREYGVLMTTHDRAGEMRAATIPHVEVGYGD